MTITTLLWLAALVQPRVEGIGINLLSSFIDAKLPKLKYINHLRRVLDKSITDFKASVTQATIPTGTYPFYDSETFYTKCLDFHLYNQSNNLDIKGIHQAISQNDKIAPCTQEDIQKFLDCFLANANGDKDLKAYFIKENYQEEIFKISSLLADYPKQIETTIADKIEEYNESILERIEELITLLLKPELKQAREQEERLQAYKAKMAKDYEKTILGEENITLKGIYIEPYYGVHKQSYNDEMPYSNALFQDTKNPLHPFIEAWVNKLPLPPYINSKCADSRVLLLLGQPGQGKSSFCSRLMYDAFHQQTFTSAPIFRINLRYVSDTEGLFRDPMNTLFKYLSGLPHNLKLDRDLFKNSILLLDGLDELIIQKDMDKVQEETFLNKLVNEIKVHYEDIRVIVTSRYQIDLSKFSQKCIILNLSPLSIEQQQDWLEKYKQQKSIELDQDTLASFQAKRHIAELIKQAILLYLIANAHRTDSPLDANANRSVLYKKLFDSLIQRKWQDNEQIQALEGIKEEPLRLLLQQVAFTIFQSDKEYVNNAQLKNILENSSNRTLHTFSLNEDSTRGLMLAFYMQKTSNDSEGNEDVSVEFLHKSLQEYLAAEYIWEQFKTIASSEPNYELTFKTLHHCFNDKFITPNITALLIEIIENDNDIIRRIIFERLRKFLPQFLEHDFLYTYNKDKNKKPIHACLNTFYGFLTIIRNAVNNTNYLTPQTQYIFIDLLTHLKTHQPDIKLNLNGLDLSNMDLDVIDLRGTNLSNVNLENSGLVLANLSRAILIGAKLGHADLQGANLSDADLSFSNTKTNYLRLSHDSSNFHYNISLEQLASTKSLYKCQGIPPELKSQLHESHPHLFKKPKD